MMLMLEALAATAVAFLLFLFLTAIGERIYEQCKKSEEEAWKPAELPPEDQADAAEDPEGERAEEPKENREENRKT